VLLAKIEIRPMTTNRMVLSLFIFYTKLSFESSEYIAACNANEISVLVKVTALPFL